MSAEQEVITLDSDDDDDEAARQRQNETTSRYDPNNYADLLLPLPSTKQQRRSNKESSGLSTFAKRFPKRPGVFPPFALFVQEEQRRRRNGKESGRQMGEIWQKLSEREKLDFRLRANQITDHRMRQWQQQVGKLSPAQKAAVQRVQANVKQKIRNTGVVPGLRIASVSSLKPPPPPPTTMNLPRGVTISRVPAVETMQQKIRQRLPSGTLLTPTAAAALPPPVKRPRLPLPPLPLPPPPPPPSSVSRAQQPWRLCRICGQKSNATSRLSDRPEVVKALVESGILKVDLQKDKRDGYPPFACRKCVSTVVILIKFKKTVKDGQRNVETSILSRRRRQNAQRLQKQQQQPEVIVDSIKDAVPHQPVNIKDEKVSIVEVAAAAAAAAPATANNDVRVKDEKQKEDSDPLMVVVVAADHHGEEQAAVATAAAADHQDVVDASNDDNHKESADVVQEEVEKAEEEVPFLDGEVVEEQPVVAVANENVIVVAAAVDEQHFVVEKATGMALSGDT